MSKGYKKKNKKEELVEEVKTLTKKEEYDLNKEKKEQEKKKSKKLKKKEKKIKKPKKKIQTNLGARIFAFVMLVLMILSVVASAAAYLS